MNKQTETPAYKYTNDILEDHGDWLLVDISTPKYPEAAMAVDTDVFNAHEGGRICAVANSNCKYIYAVYSKNKKTHLFHRDAIDVGDLEVDHVAHGTKVFIDNRRSNLRPATRGQNATNQGVRSNSTSGVTGVTWDGWAGKWMAHITVNWKKKNLGRFDNIEIAIGVRQQAEREYFGEYAYKGGEA